MKLILLKNLAKTIQPYSFKRYLLNLLKANSLLSNALNLILGTGISALLGFIFWIIVAHTFKSTSVGVATTLLTVSGILALIGLAGFDVVFVRFLSRSKRRNELINSCLIIAGIFSALLALIFCIFSNSIAPRLGFVGHNIFYGISFVLVTVIATSSTLVGAIFVAFRRTIFTLWIGVSTGLLKILLPFLMRSNSPMAIFTIVGITQAISLVAGIVLLYKYFDYKPSIKIHPEVILEKSKYTTTVYFSNILNILPDLFLPIIIINRLGSASAAYFYIAFTIANLVYTIAFSTNQALLAETAHDEVNLLIHARKGLRIVGTIMLPVVAFVVILSPFILNIFGHEYKGAVAIMRIMAITGIVVVLYSFLSFVFKHTQNLKGMLAMYIANCFAIIGLTILWIGHYGLVGVGYAWLVGTIFAVLVGGQFLVKDLKLSRIIFKLRNV